MQPWSGIPNFALIAAMLTLAAVQPNARAQDVYPTRPVRIIVPSTPGAGSDTSARVLAQEFSKRWGQSVVVENRAGAGTIVGTDLAAKAPPDGYMILLNGNSTLWALSVAVGLSVLREGAETVLFVAGLVSGSQESSFSIGMSVLAGLAAGVLAGALVYAGLGKVKPQRLFAVTNVLILLLAGNLASQLAKTMNQADWVPYLSDNAWDISSWLPNESAPGMVLHGIIGYDANPMQLQLLF